MEYIIIGLLILIALLLLGLLYQQTQQKANMQLIKKEMIAELSNTIKWSTELQKEIGLTQNNSISLR